MMILVVEDEAITRSDFAKLLALRGHQVMEAADGQQALNLLEQHQFKLVITDLALPKVTGFGLIGAIRLKWPHIPVILVTAYLSPDVAKELLTGKTKFISKPVDSNELLAAVEHLTSLGTLS
jgi:CheY-like chemotaxis protein